jgi:hypothetical protein
LLGEVTHTYNSSYGSQFEASLRKKLVIPHLNKQAEPGHPSYQETGWRIMVPACPGKKCETLPEKALKQKWLAWPA